MFIMIFVLIVESMKELVEKFKKWEEGIDRKKTKIIVSDCGEGLIKKFR